MTEYPDHNIPIHRNICQAYDYVPDRLITGLYLAPCYFSCHMTPLNELFWHNVPQGNLALFQEHILTKCLTFIFPR